MVLWCYAYAVMCGYCTRILVLALIAEVLVLVLVLYSKHPWYPSHSLAIAVNNLTMCAAQDNVIKCEQTVA